MRCWKGACRRLADTAVAQKLTGGVLGVPRCWQDLRSIRTLLTLICERLLLVRGRSPALYGAAPSAVAGPSSASVRQSVRIRGVHGGAWLAEVPFGVSWCFPVLSPAGRFVRVALRWGGQNSPFGLVSTGEQPCMQARCVCHANRGSVPSAATVPPDCAWYPR